MSRVRLVALLFLALALTAPLATGATGLRSSTAADKPSTLEAGKKIYRQFCGQCHALKEARAVGFGSANKHGVGEDG